jgi:predicted transcriptional regulator of viral defense system
VDAFTIIHRVAAGQDGVIMLPQALSAGLVKHEIDTLCRSGRWRRLARGAYLIRVGDAAEGVSRRARIRAAVQSFGPGAAAVLHTAAEVHQIAGLRDSNAVHICVPGDLARPNRRTDPAVVVHQRTIPREALTVVAGIPVTTPQQTVADVILRVGRYEAVSALDSALNRQLVSPEEFVAIPALIRRRPGAVAARCYLAEADARAQSPLETRVRLRCADGRVAPDALQHEVRDCDGYLLGIGDLAWLWAHVIGEADGAGPHASPAALFEDRRRQNRFLNAGWVVLRFTWADTLRPDYIPYVVRTALQRARSAGRAR